ncbi:MULTISPECIES: GNAT family N-acetyltransferase [unclassified Leptolyngbya]|uniref:GNAT family N-acetyltransferase n=1 Tax=unclassified Leptolyngbya TaxID=2650499 RepID=UPI0018F034D9|nr:MULTISPECIES: GNAT family N-acetyltransferase [unclassified Leptolyngbya]
MNLQLMDANLTTGRLQLRPCSRLDIEFLHTLWMNDRIRYYLFDDRIISHEESRTFIEASLNSFERHGYGLWLVHHQNQCIGFAGFLDTEAIPSLIYGIHPDFWGQGYATEAARAVLEYGLRILKLQEVNADVDEPNIASVQVLRKLGMKQVNRTLVNGRPLLYFSIEPDSEE